MGWDSKESEWLQSCHLVKTQFTAITHVVGNRKYTCRAQVNRYQCLQTLQPPHHQCYSLPSLLQIAVIHRLPCPAQGSYSHLPLVSRDSLVLDTPYKWNQQNLLRWVWLLSPSMFASLCTEADINISSCVAEWCFPAWIRHVAAFIRSQATALGSPLDYY